MTAKTPAELSDAAAEAIRGLNHATRIAQADWEYPGDAYSTVAGLSRMAMGLTQALDQIRGFVAQLEVEGRLRSDKDTLEADLIETYGGLRDAATVAGSLYAALNRAHSGLGSIAYQD